MTVLRVTLTLGELVAIPVLDTLAGDDDVTLVVWYTIVILVIVSFTLFTVIVALVAVALAVILVPLLGGVLSDIVNVLSVYWTFPAASVALNVIL